MAVIQITASECKKFDAKSSVALAAVKVDGGMYYETKNTKTVLCVVANLRYLEPVTVHSLVHPVPGMPVPHAPNWKLQAIEHVDSALVQQMAPKLVNRQIFVKPLTKP